MVRPLFFFRFKMSGPDASLPPEPPPYIYAASDIHPRTTREIELCDTASHFDWQYSGTLLAMTATAAWANIQPLKNADQPSLRLLGPSILGLTWGSFLTGTFLSFPKCDPNWVAPGGPEGNVRVQWPIQLVITILAGASAPFMDWSFLGPIKTAWSVPERSGRTAVAVAGGLIGSLLPYLLPPATWRAKKEIEKLRVEGTLGGATVGYWTTF